MLTGTISHCGALVSAIVVLTGGAILRDGAAAADPNQDDQFLALLDKEGIPALGGVSSLIDTAHDVCRTLDAGMPADGLVDAMVNHAYDVDPTERQYPRGRLARTEARFITAAVGAYCPYDRSKLAAIRVDSAAAWGGPTHRAAADTYTVNRSECDAHGAVPASLIGTAPSGEISPTDPPQIPPPPPPPPAQIRIPPRPIAAPTAPKHPPPPPQQAPPPPQQPPPPPQQAEPPAVVPQPGGAAGGGGGGSTGGGGGGIRGGAPAEPPPADPSSPGFVTLAP
jgi:hypothetical protein